MNGESQDVLEIIQAKLSSGEKVRNILLNVKIHLRDTENDDRIIALVECNSTFALFVFISEERVPKKFSDLTINRTIPIDEYFSCDTDTIPSQTHLQFNVIYKSIKLPFIIEVGNCSSMLAKDIIKAQEACTDSTPDHKWLEKYNLMDSDCSESDYNEQTSNPVSRQTFAKGHGSASRDSMFRFEMESRKAQYTLHREFSIFVGSWNVNGEPPPESLKAWLCCDSEPPLLYALGFQELDLSKEAFLFNDTPREGEWEKAVISSTHPGAKYRSIALIRLVGIQLIVLIHIDHYGQVRDLACDTVGTGILGKMGNKGGVAIRLKLYDTTLCFVNSHLAAHQEEVDRRNQDYRDINDRINFRRPPQTIKEHDQVYWMGDLNYRVQRLNHEDVKKFIYMKELNQILKYDQLLDQKSRGKVFEGYTENDITFQPTYKFDLNTDKYDTSEKSRSPAWTDRVLYRGKGIHQVAYRSHMDFRTSDHKPISALFKSEIAIIEESKQKKVQEEVFKLMDKLENEILPQVTVDQTEILFGTVRFKEAVTREIIVANTGQVPVDFNFANKVDENTYCKNWLRISPYCGSIEPGEKCDIRFEIIFEEAVNKLEDILVLHLENGKDIFITVSGVCQISCFTSSISVLCRAVVPILHMTPEQLRLAESEQSPVLYSVPRELWLMVDYLYRNGLKTRDLFESTALHDDIIKIRDWLDNGSLHPILDNVSAVAESLLLFLSHTKDPVIPHYLTEKCTSQANNFYNCQQIILQLPDLHRNVFLYVIMFLKELLKYSAENGTDAKLLATIFGEILLRSPAGKVNKPQTFRGKLIFIHHFLVNDISSLIIPSK